MGENAFDDPNGKFGLSDMAMKYLGGLLTHAQDNCAILASHVNSYKRLVPGYEAPCYISWANMNRSALIRVPAGRGGRTRVELRNPDPAGNPYLQFAVMLAAGLDGIERNLNPPEPVEKDIYHMSKEERKKLRHRLPAGEPGRGAGDLLPEQADEGGPGRPHLQPLHAHQERGVGRVPHLGQRLGASSTT